MGEVVPVPVSPPGVLVTVYHVIDEPPVDTGGVNDIDADWFDILSYINTANTLIGADGTVIICTGGCIITVTVLETALFEEVGIDEMVLSITEIIALGDLLSRPSIV